MSGSQDYTVAPPQKASNQDAIMIVVLLLGLLFFLLRNVAKFRSDGRFPQCKSEVGSCRRRGFGAVWWGMLGFC